ncbi:MAG: phospholipase A, partial [Endozoicomonas sp.]
MHNHSGRLCSVISLLVLSLISRQVSAETYDECLARLVQQGETTMTLGQIRSQCQPVPNTRAAENPIGQRIEDERETMDNRFSITPHRPNYLLPLSYNKSPNHAPFENSSNDDFSNTEIKFQLSLKAPLVLGLFKGYGDIYVAYTNTSWWQAYNDNSAPFRETNHEPEIFLALPTRYQLSGFELNTVMLGLSHQSNGRSGRISRSRNRLYANFIFSKGAFVASLKPWWR